MFVDESDDLDIFAKAERDVVATSRRNVALRVLIVAAIAAGAMAILLNHGEIFTTERMFGRMGLPVATSPTPTATAIPTTTATPTATADDPATAGPTTAPAPPAGTDAAAAVTVDPTNTNTKTNTGLDPADTISSVVAQSRLVQAEDATLRRIVAAGAAGVDPDHPVIVLDGAGARYDLSTLESLGAIVRLDDSTLQLQYPVVVLSGASLTLNAPGQTLRLADSPTGITSLVSWGGTISLNGSASAPLTLLGWDTARDAADTHLSDGRAYVRVTEGTLYTSNTTFSHLGFWSGRTGGLAVTGSAEVPGRAQIVSSTSSALHIGIYLSSTDSVVIADSSIEDADTSGLEIDNNATATVVTTTEITSSGDAGITAGAGANNLTLDAVAVTGNGGNGIRFEGTARATGASTDGYSVENAAGLHITNSTVSDNSGSGIAVIATTDVDITTTKVDQHGAALTVAGSADHVTIADSTLSSATGTALVISGGVTDVLISGNTVSGGTTGGRITDSQSNLVSNKISVDTGTGVVLAGTHTTGLVTGNSISGIGPAAISQRDTSETITVGRNSDSKWSHRTLLVLWFEHNPLAWGGIAVVLMLIVAGVLLAGRRARLRDQRDERDLDDTDAVLSQSGEHPRDDAEKDTGHHVTDHTADHTNDDDDADDDILGGPTVEAEDEAAASAATTPTPAGRTRWSVLKPRRGARPKAVDEDTTSTPPVDTPRPAPAPTAGPREGDTGGGDGTRPPLSREPQLRHPGRWTIGGPPGSTSAPTPASVPGPTPAARATPSARPAPTTPTARPAPESRPAPPARPMPAARAMPAASNRSNVPLRTSMPPNPSATSTGAAAAGRAQRAKKKAAASAAAAPDTRGQAEAADVTGRIASVEQLAVAAVIQSGRPIAEVASTLRVSPSVVAYWVAKARGEH